jgi:hypothetical protein
MVGRFIDLCVNATHTIRESEENGETRLGRLRQVRYTQELPCVCVLHRVSMRRSSPASSENWSTNDSSYKSTHGLAEILRDVRRLTSYKAL